MTEPSAEEFGQPRWRAFVAALTATPRWFRTGLSGSFRFGAVTGVLFILVGQSCWTRNAELQQAFEDELRSHEAAEAHPPSWLLREYREAVRETLLHRGRNPALRSLPPPSFAQWLQDRRPTRAWPEWYILIPTLLLGTVLVVRSVHHPDDKAREALWSATRSLLLFDQVLRKWKVAPGLMNPRTGRFVQLPVDLDPKSGKVRFEGRTMKRRKNPKP